MASAIWGVWALHLLNDIMVFALQLRKSTENLSRGSRLVADRSRRLGRLFMDSLGWPAKYLLTSVTRGALQSAVGWHGCRTKGFPSSAIFEPKLSPSVLWCSRQKMESPNPREFACYLRLTVR
jgi:hypothetical protein